MYSAVYVVNIAVGSPVCKRHQTPRTPEALSRRAGWSEYVTSSWDVVVVMKGSPDGYCGEVLSPVGGCRVRLHRRTYGADVLRGLRCKHSARVAYMQMGSCSEDFRGSESRLGRARLGSPSPAATRVVHMPSLSREMSHAFVGVSPATTPSCYSAGIHTRMAPWSRLPQRK